MADNARDVALFNMAVHSGGDLVDADQGAGLHADYGMARPSPASG